MSNTWSEETCPGCHSINFVNLGDLGDGDCSKFDPDGYRCWKCQRVVLWLPEEDWKAEWGDNLLGYSVEQLRTGQVSNFDFLIVPGKNMKEASR